MKKTTKQNKTKFKHLFFGVFIILTVLCIIYSKSIFAATPSINVSTNGNGSVSWTSNLVDSKASCDLFVTQYISNEQDNIIVHKSIKPSGGTYNFTLPSAPDLYFYVIDCMVDMPPWVIHSNQLMIGHGEFHNGYYKDKGDGTMGVLPNYYSWNPDSPPKATDAIRVFGIRNINMQDQLAPYDDPEDPTIFSWYVENYNGTVPNYDKPIPQFRLDKKTFVPTDDIYFSCTFTYPDGTKELNPTNTLRIYQKKNFDAVIECKNIITAEVGGGPSGILKTTDGESNKFIKVRPNPQYNKVFASPVPPLVPFGGTAKIHYSSNGDFCKIAEYPLLMPNKDGSVLNFSPNWGLTSSTGIGDFPIPAFEKQANFNVTCYTEHSCVGALSTNDSKCAVANTQNDCFNVTDDSGTMLCNWGRTSSTTGGNVGAKNPTTNFLDFAKASVRIYNFSLNMMGNGFIVDTATTEPEDITDTTAVLTGEMNPNGQDSELREANSYFRYTLVDTFPPIFCNDIFGSSMLSTTEQRVGPARTIQRVTASVANLYPNTTYYYCIVGSNNDQITYGGIKSFTTKMTPPDINGNPDPNYYSTKLSVTTKSATVVDEQSAYLKGSFNTDISAATWFEYQKANSGPTIQNININGNNPSASIFDFFFKPNIAIAATNTNTATNGSAYQWKKVFAKERFPGTNGNFSFLLSNLSPSTTYNFRTVIKDTRFSIIKYGDTLSFTTKNATTSGPRTKPPVGALPAEPLCKNKLDINCNGTGSLPGTNPETDPGTGSELINLSDLTASDISASALVVGKPITLSVTIINQGTSTTSATIKSQKPSAENNSGNTTTTSPVKIINNQKRINPTSIPPKPKPSTNIKRVTPEEINSNLDINGTNVMQGGASTSFFKDIFTTKTAFALTTSSNSLNSGTRNTTGTVNNNSADINTTTSIINDTRTPTGIASKTYPGTSADGGFYNFFQVSTVNPNTISELNSSIVNLPAIKTSELSPKTSRVLTQEYTFSKEGTYYIRACADKKNPADTGTIQESYEANNCGTWTTFTIGNKQMCEDPNALNYGTRAPCVSKVGKCIDFSANNYGSPLPCNFDTTNNNTGGGSGTVNTNPSDLQIGDTAVAPDLAIVRYHEGIETVLQRQIVADTTLAKNYGYQDGADIQSFAWTLADVLAKTFGYVGANGKEIRVSLPDIAAYQLYVNNGILTVYEYYDGKIVNIQRMTDALRSKYGYEYYFNKKQ